MSKKKKLLVIIPERLSEGVIQSQIVDFFDKLIDVEILYLTKTEIKIQKENLITVKGYNRVYSVIRRFQPDYAYLRSPIQYWILLFMLWSNRVKIIYSFRALVFVESYFKNKNLIKAFLLFIAEMGAYWTSNKVTTVTLKLKSKLHKYFLFKRSCSIIPCYCTTKFKKRPNLEDDVKMVYVGGASKWQCVDEMLNLFSNLIIFLPKLALTIYTPEKDYFDSKVLTMPPNVKNLIRIISIHREELIEELPGYDIGLLLRRNSLVNNIASPIKFYEYVNAGVVPIITPYLGDISEDPKTLEFALMYDFDKSSISGLADSIREYAQDRAQTRDIMSKFEEKVDVAYGLREFQKLLN